MALEYKVYGCKFKCGARHIKSKKLMEIHEEKCWYNPLNKTCLTCKHSEMTYEYDPHDEMECCPSESCRYRVCNHSDEMSEKYSEYTENLKEGTEDIIKKSNAYIYPMINCEKWELKEECYDSRAEF